MESIRDEFECQVCLNYMTSSIQICKMGHSFCNFCDQFVQNCPICREPKWDVCNLALEAMFENLLIPCENAATGCATLIRGDNWLGHKNYCTYADNVDCLLSKIKNCSWAGSPKDMMGHCLQFHRHNAFKSSDVHLLCPYFKNGRFPGEHCCDAKRKYRILLWCHEEIFKCVWHINPCNGYTQWCVYRMSPKPFTKYNFYITFQNTKKSRDYPSITLSSVCYDRSVETCLDGFMVSVYSSPLCVLSGPGGLYYTISIRKQGELPPSKSDLKACRYFVPTSCRLD